MKQHEREYFISIIRSGKYIYRYNDLKLEILSPTFDDEVEINRAYIIAYEESLADGCMTMDQNVEWMKEIGLWSEEQEKKIQTATEDIEKLKEKLFLERNNSSIVNSARHYLKAARKLLNNLGNEKNTYFSQTCEGIASTEKSYELVRRCTYLNGKNYDFDEIPIDKVVTYLFSQFLPESKIRELSRTDPWRSHWSINNTFKLDLFANTDRTLFTDQRNIIMWSRMYDNIQESMDCPDEEVINDDDMLDGWFITQRKKREQEKKQSNMENQLNSKVANSQEVFLMANNKEDAKKINSINSSSSMAIKRQRFAQMKNREEVNQIDLQDEQMKLRTKATQGFKNKFRR